MRTSVVLKVAGLMVIVTFVASACGGGEQQVEEATEETEVELRTVRGITGGSAGLVSSPFFTAVELGFFAEEGLELSFDGSQGVRKGDL